MARIRTVKPELFRHELLFDLERELGYNVRIAWIGLFAICDREGRFKWRPRTIKAEIMPYDEIDFSRVLHAFATRGLVVKYTCGTPQEEYGCIPTFRKHQIINNKELPSTIPPPEKGLVIELDKEPSRHIPRATMRLVLERDGCCQVCFSVDQLEFDHVIPFSRGGGHEISNLQILCRACNIKKSDNIIDLATRAPHVSHTYATPDRVGKAEGKGRERKGTGREEVIATINIPTEQSTPEIEEEPASQEHEGFHLHATDDASTLLLEVDERVRHKISLSTLNGWVKKYGTLEWIKPEISKACDQIEKMPSPPKHLVRYIADALRYARSVLDGTPVRNPYSETNKAIEVYCDAYKRRYGHEPKINPMVRRQMSMFVGRIGEDAPAVLEFYLDHRDGWYVKTQHPVGAALKNAEGLYTQWKSGRAITANDVRQFEKTDAVMSQLERIERGLVR